MKVFGCLALASNPSRSHGKFQPRGVPCLFLGYPQTQKGYKLLQLDTQKDFVTKDAKFFETLFPYKIFAINSSPNASPSSSPLSINTNTTDPLLLVPHADPIIAPPAPYPIPPTLSPVVALKWSIRVTHPPSWHSDYAMHTQHDTLVTKIDHVGTTSVTPGYTCLLARSLSTRDLVHFKHVVQYPHWVQAMNEELDSLEFNKTWVITDLPPMKKAIGSKWVYKTKYNANGSIDKYKARLVILGNLQVYGEDYNQTFAPVAKMTIVRSLLAVAASKSWHVHQMDVKMPSYMVIWINVFI